LLLPLPVSQPVRANPNVNKTANIPTGKILFFFISNTPLCVLRTRSLSRRQIFYVNRISGQHIHYRINTPAGGLLPLFPPDSTGKGSNAAFGKERCGKHGLT
jgi:hypothetical protein